MYTSSWTICNTKRGHTQSRPPSALGHPCNQVSQRGRGQLGASAKHTHSPQASKKCPFPPSRSRNVFCPYLWCVTENKDGYHSTARGLNKSYPSPLPPRCQGPFVWGVFPQQRPMKSANQEAESNLSWLLVPKPAGSSLLLSLPRPTPLPQERGSSVHLVA